MTANGSSARRTDASPHAVALALALAAATVPAARAAAQQEPAATCRLQVDGAVHGVVVRGAATFAAAGQSVQAVLPAGTWQLAFPAGGGGRPAQLDVEAPPGGEVLVAVAPPPDPAQAPFADVPTKQGTATIAGADDDRDVRVAATVEVERGAAGVCVRWTDDRQHYRLVLDRDAGQVRLERQLGTHALVLAKAEVAAADAPHRLELQAEGFRLLGLLDERTVASVLDGALTHGRFGTVLQPGAAARFSEFRAAPPAVPGTTVAAVASPGRVDVRVAAPALVADVVALGLRLDRPEPAWPTDAQGFEPALLQDLAEPWVLLGFATGEIDPQGGFAASFAWPVAATPRGHAALVTGWVGAPDASTLLQRLPCAAVRF